MEYRTNKHYIVHGWPIQPETQASIPERFGKVQTPITRHCALRESFGSATAYYHLPEAQVLEIGLQLSL